MAVQNVDKVNRVASAEAAGTQQVEDRRRRLELYSAETWEKHRGSEFHELSRFSLPLSDAERAQVQGLFDNLPPEDRQRMAAASIELARALATPGAVGATGEMSAGLRSASSAAVATYLLTQGADDLSSANQAFLAMGLAGMEYQLGGFAERVATNTAITRELRTEISELRDMLSDWPEGETQSFTYTQVTFDEDGRPTVQEVTVELTKDEAQALMQNLESSLTSAQEVGSLMQFDVQRMHQDYQQAVQTLATIQKQVYDDAKQILNNLRA